MLEITEVEAPRAGPGEALVRVAAAAVNFPDVLIIADRYQISVPTPFVPGSEFAGEVVEIGEGVDDVAIGDRVSGTTFHGAFAELVAAPTASLTAVPEGIALSTAAAFWVAYGTAYHSLRSVAEVNEGDTVLVLGAAGGVGLAAVELAEVLGADVIAAASSEEKLAVCRERGARFTVDYEHTDLRARLREIAPEGIDVVIDPVGGRHSEPALRAMRWGGRFVTVGFASGDIASIPLNLVLLKGVIVRGFEFRGFAENAAASLERDRRELTELLGAGRLRPHVAATYPLAEAGAALRLLADRRATGKVVIIP